ncbi:MAG: hypothetical protein SGBAC_006493 [Bacillariaceae sp.]
MSRLSRALVCRGQKPITPAASNVAITTSVVPDGCFKHYFVEEVGDVHFEEGVEAIGEGAFSMCWTLGNIRMPLSLNTIQRSAFAHCMLHLRSVELPPKAIHIGDRAFQGCARLRNIALDSNDDASAELGTHLFKGCHNLSVIFQDPSAMIKALTQRFDGLPVHRICYYQSYFSTEKCLQNLKQIEPVETESDRQQDCLGMTPLHILCLAKAHHLALYQACVEHCPSDLNTKDAWGSLPIHYALENNVPMPIAEFLLEQHQKHHPSQPMFFDQFLLKQGVDFFNSASLPLVQLVLGYHEKHGQEPLDWDRLLQSVSMVSSLEIFRCVVSQSVSPRIRALEWQPWRQAIEQTIHDISKESLQGECWTPMDQKTRTGIDVVEEIQSKLTTYEKRTTLMLLELICWKCRLVATSLNNKEETSDDDIRTNCRIRSGAEYIAPLVLSFL